jgi:hypothetical protein
VGDLVRRGSRSGRGGRDLSRGPLHAGLGRCGRRPLILVDRRAIPAALPWLGANPHIPFHPVSATNLLLSDALWMTLWTAALMLAPSARR